jgi:predicted nucleotidyltransferase
MPKQPIELMFGAYRRALLATLLLRPDERYHVRELARMTDISAGSIHRELKVMAAAGMLLRNRIGNQVFYQANRACPIFEELAAIFRKTIGLATLLQDALLDLSDKIDLAFVFGSMATGQQTSSSDVDVMVLGNLALLDVVKALSPLQQVLGREINPVAMTADRFTSQLDNQERFAIRVLEEPKVFVKGDEREFAQLVEDRAAR